MKDDEVAALQAKTSGGLPSGPLGSHGIGLGGFDLKAILVWAVVGIPLAWGIWITLSKSLALFR